MEKPKMFRRHMMTVHNYNKIGCFRCPICMKEYSIPSAYKKHLQKHRDEKLSINTTLNKQLASTTISEQTLNNAKAMSTPVNSEKKDKKNMEKTESSIPKPKPKTQEVETTVHIESSSIKKKKKKRALEEPESNKVESKKKKLFEKIKDDTMAEETTLIGEIVETYTCSQCKKTVSSEKKLKKHVLKKHS